MSQPSSSSVLNRLLAICARSLSMYLADVRPYYANKNDQLLEETLSHVVADQQRQVDMIVDLLLDMRAEVNMGDFPMNFASCHDCSLEYLATELIRFQKQDITAIESCVTDLKTSTSARAIAEETLGIAKGHLLSLEEAMQKTLSSAS